MPRGVITTIAALVVGAALSAAGPAAAQTYCYGVADPACTVNEGTLQAALSDAAADIDPTSVIEVAAGTAPNDGLHYPGPAIAGHVVQIVGSPTAPTIITDSSGDVTPVFDCAGGALTLNDIQIHAPLGSTAPGLIAEAGCSLTLQGVSIDTLQGSGDALDMLGGGSITNSTISASTAAAQAVHITATAPTTIVDSTIGGASGIVDDGSGMVTAHRLTVIADGAGASAVAAQAFAAGASLTIDDSLLRTSAGAQALLASSAGAPTHNAAVVARQVTAVVDDGVAALPFRASTSQGSASVTVYDALASGYTQGVRLDGGGAATAIALHHTALTSPATPSTATGTFTYAHADDVLDIATHQPRFVDPAGGDFHLGAGSPLIDEDATPLAGGESPTDRFGDPRVVNAKRDLGAIEHQPTSVTTDVPATAIVGQSVAFSATVVSDAGPETFTWTFGDGGTFAQVAGSHAYGTAGVYHWSLTVSDGAAAPLASTGTITVSSPPVVSTLAADGVTANAALLHGTLNANGAATSYHFDYGPSSAYGQQTTLVAAGSGVQLGAVSAQLVNLAAEHTYHVRLVAVQGATVVYGADQAFRTGSPVPVASASPAAPAPNPPVTTPVKPKAAPARCRIPTLMGRTLTQAHRALLKAHCKLGAVKHRRVHGPTGRVVAQQRRAGRTYARNTRVGVTVGRR